MIAKSVPALLEGRSVAIKSYTGSGKTLAYLVPVVARALAAAAEAAREGASPGDGGPYAVIVAPSRELAMQIVREGQSLLGRRAGDDGHRMVQQAIGGASMPRQIDALRTNRPLIVVGTPGRLADLSREGSLRTHGASVLVLDEADDLAADNFAEPMGRLLAHVGKNAPGDQGRQLVLVSATLAQRTLEAAAAAGHADIELVAPGAAGGASVGAGERAAQAGLGESLPPNLTHAYLVVPRRHAYDALRRSLRASGVSRAAVFMNYARRLPDAEQRLQAAGVSCVSLHGGMDKIERGNALSKYRRGDVDVLLLNEVGARGLDVPECDGVFNLELPADGRHYVHRAGRAGRMNREGLVLTIVDPAEAFVVNKFERELGGDVRFMEVVLREGELQEVTREMKAEALDARRQQREQRNAGGGGARAHHSEVDDAEADPAYGYRGGARAGRGRGGRGSGRGAYAGRDRGRGGGGGRGGRGEYGDQLSYNPRP
eukprot:PRCOL_00003092-RA